MSYRTEKEWREHRASVPSERRDSHLPCQGSGVTPQEVHLNSAELDGETGLLACLCTCLGPQCLRLWLCLSLGLGECVCAPWPILIGIPVRSSRRLVFSDAMPGTIQLFLPLICNCELSSLYGTAYYCPIGISTAHLLTLLRVT